MSPVYRFGDNVDTDAIVPGKYLSLSTPEELAKVCMEGLDPNLPGKFKPGDIFVAGNNFGCGSSREHAPISLKGAGIACVIARSFARIFFRNAINIGLPVLESAEAAEKIQEGDTVSVDFSAGRIVNNTRNEEYAFAPYPESIMNIIRAGGLSPLVRSQKA